MKDLIRKILNEEITDRAKEKLLALKDKIGLGPTIKAVGGAKNFIKIAYDGDIKKYYQESGFKPFDITKGDKINMYIDDFVVQLLNLEDKGFSGRNEKMLGNFVYQPQKNGVEYKFTGYLHPSSRATGQKLWRVVGMSGSSGFGYSFINQRDVLGNRSRKQIFDQIIDKYNLDSYK